MSTPQPNHNTTDSPHVAHPGADSIPASFPGTTSLSTANFSSNPVESPSLFTFGKASAAAYELKFLLSEEQARRVEEAAGRMLFIDPYGRPELDGAYQTTTLYFDTPAHDVYFRRKIHRIRKYRLRRYRDEMHYYLERKTKKNDRVKKRRAEILVPEISLLAGDFSPPEWPGHWFHRQLRRRQLHPVSRVSYQRKAYLGMVDNGAIRVTFDRKLHGELESGWNVLPAASGNELLPGRVICEFKYRTAVPRVFQDIITSERMELASVSKYRLFMSLAGIDPGGNVTDA